MPNLRHLALAAAACCLALPAVAQNLAIGIGGAITSADPHFYNSSPNNALATHIFDRLVERDARAQLYPGLAESWQPVGETVWEFKLRGGVNWHDGRGFSADDVAFSMERAPRVPNSPGGFGGAVRAITRVEVVNPTTIRFLTARPHPLLPNDLASVAIVSRRAAAGASTEDYNNGRAAIGTGPYRLLRYRAGDTASLARNDAWFGPRQPWARVEYRFIGNDTARTGALLGGEVQVIDQVHSSDLQRLRRDSRVVVSETPGLGVMFLAADQSRRGNLPYVSDNAGLPLDANPFSDVRVRRALSLAVNRAALAALVMEGAAQPTGQWLPPDTFGYNPEVTVPPFDAEGARRLLAEAGFANGFRLTLHTPNDRYPNDLKAAQAVAQMWNRIGVRTEVEALPWTSFAERSARQEFAMRLAGWGSASGEASSALVSLLGTHEPTKLTGLANDMRYSNPALDSLTERAVATPDNAAREALLREAVAMAMEDVAVIPLYQLTNSWALKRGLRHEPRMDERTLAMGVHPQ